MMDNGTAVLVNGEERFRGTIAGHGYQHTARGPEPFYVVELRQGFWSDTQSWNRPHGIYVSRIVADPESCAPLKGENDA